MNQSINKSLKKKKKKKEIVVEARFAIMNMGIYPGQEMGRERAEWGTNAKHGPSPPKKPCKVFKIDHCEDKTFLEAIVT